MFNPNNKQSDILERFRIKAHMRRYVRDPFTIEEQLMADAATRLKGMEFRHSDPSELIAAEITLQSYNSGFYRLEELTEEGEILVKQERFRRKLGNARALGLRILRPGHS